MPKVRLLQPYYKEMSYPSHLVDLYLQSVGRGRATQAQKYETHFNYQLDTTREEASCSQQVPEEPSRNPIPGGEDLATETMIVEYASNDIFETLNRLPISKRFQSLDVLFTSICNI